MNTWVIFVFQDWYVFRRCGRFVRDDHAFSTVPTWSKGCQDGPDQRENNKSLFPCLWKSRWAVQCLAHWDERGQREIMPGQSWGVVDLRFPWALLNAHVAPWLPRHVTEISCGEGTCLLHPSDNLPGTLPLAGTQFRALYLMAFHVMARAWAVGGSESHTGDGVDPAETRHAGAIHPGGAWGKPWVRKCSDSMRGGQEPSCPRGD